MPPLPLKTPDITPAQVLSVLAAVAAQAIAYGALSPHTGQFLVSIAGLIVPFTWTAADAIIRHGRARAGATLAAARAVPPPAPAAASPPPPVPANTNAGIYPPDAPSGSS